MLGTKACRVIHKCIQAEHVNAAYATRIKRFCPASSQNRTTGSRWTGTEKEINVNLDYAIILNFGTYKIILEEEGSLKRCWHILCHHKQSKQIGH